MFIHISHAQEKEFQCEQYGIVPYNSNEQRDGLCKYSMEMVCVCTARKWCVKYSKKIICEVQQGDSLCKYGKKMVCVSTARR